MLLSYRKILTFAGAAPRFSKNPCSTWTRAVEGAGQPKFMLSGGEIQVSRPGALLPVLVPKGRCRYAGGGASRGTLKRSVLTLEIRKMPLRELHPADYNPRVDLQPGDPEYEKLKRSVLTYGCVQLIVWNERTRNVVGGHQTIKVLQDLGLEETEVSVVDLDENSEKALNVALNKISGDWDEDKLTELIRELAEADGFDAALTGFDEEEIEELLREAEETFQDKLSNSPPSSVFDTFIVPPFSVLDTRQGYWRERKQHWIDLGIRSEVGRDGNLLFPPNLKIGKNDNGTSIFDPVLCEVMYRWFNIPGGHILDPFAGGSVRGIVAKLGGYSYTGIDLRQEQITSNQENAAELGVDTEGLTWICDDSQLMDRHIQDASADMLFTCPPYFDLEVYSDDPRDVSNMPYDGFTKAYTAILAAAAQKLKENRFAVVVLSNVRDKEGYYRDLVKLTGDVFEKNGLRLYNDVVLMNVVGSAAFRVRRSMRNRKMVRVHQNVLVFYKGRPADIKEHFEELTELDEDRIADELGEDE